MADNDIYNNETKYFRYLDNLEVLRTKPTGTRKYQII